MPKAKKAAKLEEKIVLDLQEFDPTVAELTKMVEATKDITATDLKDKDQLAVVRENRITLKKARVRIEKAGKEYRDPANEFIKKVMAKQKELVAIIEPEEERLAEIEAEAEKLAIMEDRREKLPARKERLAEVGITDIPDEALLDLDSEAFEGFYNRCVADKLANDELRAKAEQEEAQAKIDAERAALDAEKQKLEDEKREIEHQKEVAAAADKARAEATAQAEKQAEEAKIAAEAKEKAEAEAKSVEQEKLAKRAEYVEFLKSHGYTKETAGEFHTIETTTGYDLYKKVGTFNK